MRLFVLNASSPPSLVSVLCLSCGGEFTMKGFCSPLESDLSRRIYTVGNLCCYNTLLQSVFFLSDSPSWLPHSVARVVLSLFISCLAAAPSKTQRPFSDVVPLSLSLFSLHWVCLAFQTLLEALLLCPALISWYRSVFWISVCVCVYECVSRQIVIRWSISYVDSYIFMFFST